MSAPRHVPSGYISGPWTTAMRNWLAANPDSPYSSGIEEWMNRWRAGTGGKPPTPNPTTPRPTPTNPSPTRPTTPAVPSFDPYRGVLAGATAVNPFAPNNHTAYDSRGGQMDARMALGAAGYRPPVQQPVVTRPPVAQPPVVQPRPPASGGGFPQPTPQPQPTPNPWMPRWRAQPAQPAPQPTTPPATGYNPFNPPAWPGPTTPTTPRPTTPGFGGTIGTGGRFNMPSNWGGFTPQQPTTRPINARPGTSRRVSRWGF